MSSLRQSIKPSVMSPRTDLVIDGSQGEGGGQILRTALTLSMCTSRPFTIHSIRSRRSRPGLMRQHLVAVEAAATLSEAEVEGAALGSTALHFIPRKTRGGRFSFAVGSAGSTTLILQTLLPALLRCDNPTRVILKGGTHNPMAPPFDSLERSFLPLIRRMGARVAARLIRPGFFPAGGGEIEAEVEPSKLCPITVLERGKVLKIGARALVSNLPLEIAQREINVLRKNLDISAQDCTACKVDAFGPGNVLIVDVESAHITEVFTGFGERGKRAERIAQEVAQEVTRYLDSGVPVGEHLADQLLVPMALAGGGRFRTLPPTPHASTNARIIETFLPVRVRFTEEDKTNFVEIDSTGLDG